LCFHIGAIFLCGYLKKEDLTVFVVWYLIGIWRLFGGYALNVAVILRRFAIKVIIIVKKSQKGCFIFLEV
jgi:hypothetical protein